MLEEFYAYSQNDLCDSIKAYLWYSHGDTITFIFVMDHVYDSVHDVAIILTQGTELTPDEAEKIKSTVKKDFESL